MRIGSLVECINGEGWQDIDSLDIHNYGPEYKEICTVDGVDGGFIHLVEYPDRDVSDPDFYDKKMFREIQPPMKIDLSFFQYELIP